MFSDKREYIERFCSYFADKKDQISAIKSATEESGIVFKKALYCLLIDAMSRSVFPKKADNRKRFKDFIKNFGDWKERDLISTPHLFKLLEIDPDPAFVELRKEVLKKMKNWNATWNEITIDQDYEWGDILKLWPRGLEKKIGGLCLEDITHVNLLYEYRNSLVHEFRTPGYGIEYLPNKLPFYHSMSSIENEDGSGPETMELVYPLEFLEKLVNTLIGNLKRYLLENQINPYHSYRFGSYWRESLN
jgi:hypothetical protein